MHRVTWHRKSDLEQGIDPEKWKGNVSMGGWFCPTRSICEATFRRGWQISSVCTHFSDYPNQYLENFSSLSLPSLIQPCLFLDFYFLSCSFWLLVNGPCGLERVKRTCSWPQKSKRITMVDICCLFFFPPFKLGISVPTPILLSWWLNTVHEVEICLLAPWNFLLQFTLENVGG